MNYFKLGPRLTLIFAVLIALILGGNAILIWQFQIVHRQTERLIGGHQQVIAVLRLHESLLSFHQRLDELVRSRDTRRVIAEVEPLRRTLVEHIQQARNTLTHLPSATRIDSSFLPTLDAIEIDLASQIDAIAGLTTFGHWEAVRIRLDTETEILESQISALVKNIDQESSAELTNAVASMGDAQQRILFLVPTMAISTFLIASFFGWAMTQRIGELRLEEQIRERMRIARDLHDTLLQSFQAVLLKLHAVTYVIPDRPAEAQKRLENVIEQGSQAITEGRDTVQWLRSSAVLTNDLATALGSLGQDLADSPGNAAPPTFHVEVEGSPRELHPILWDEVYRIAGEALRNAFRHAQAHRVEVVIHYDEQQLSLHIRDDGKGISPEVLEEKGRPGHWGLQGMSERARRIGGTLELWSRPEAGTEVRLQIPGAKAYKSPDRAKWFSFWRSSNIDIRHNSR